MFTLQVLSMHSDERMQLEREAMANYRELVIMKKISSVGNCHVVTMVGFIVDQHHALTIVMEYAPYGNLHDFLVDYKNMVSVFGILCRTLCCEFIRSCISLQRLPDAAIVAPLTRGMEEFQRYYNTIALKPQDVVSFAQQIASGMVRKHTMSAKYQLGASCVYSLVSMSPL